MKPPLPQWGQIQSQSPLAKGLIVEPLRGLWTRPMVLIGDRGDGVFDELLLGLGEVGLFEQVDRGGDGIGRG